MGRRRYRDGLTSEMFSDFVGRGVAAQKAVNAFGAGVAPSARELADEGIARAEGRANRANADWSEGASIMLNDFLRTQSEPFMAEQVRAFAESKGLPAAPDPRAWGGVMQRAARRKLIVGVGFSESSNRQAHCRPTKLWSRT